MPHTSLRTAIIRPFLLLILLVLLVFSLLAQLDYRYLSRTQGARLLATMGESTKHQISAFFHDALSINHVLVLSLETSSKVEEEGLQSIQHLYHTLFLRIYQDLPQISVLSYGDEKHRYVGIRDNDGRGNFSLMLKDERTEGSLNIYATVEKDSTILASFPNYDPRKRPWYAPLLQNPVTQWTDVYLNLDEKMEATLSLVSPVWDTNQNFKGVSAVDVKLTGIASFLDDQSLEGESLIYVLNEKNELLVQSGRGETFRVEEGDPPKAMFITPKESTEPLVRESYARLFTEAGPREYAVPFLLQRKRYFAQVTPLREPAGLNWSIIVVIPEKALLGGLRVRQTTTLFSMVCVLILGTFLASYAVKKTLKPIEETTHAAYALSQGDFEVALCAKESSIHETMALTEAFTEMARSLRSSFGQIQEKEAQYRLLVENMEDMVYSFTPEGLLLSVNRSFEERFSRDAEQLRGKNVFALFEPYAPFAFLTSKLRIVEETREKCTFLLDSPMEERLVWNVSWIPIFGSKNRLLAILGTNTNSTDLVVARENLEALHARERERLEHLISEKSEALSFALKELIEKEKLASLGNLVSGVAHEVNTPLGVSVSAASYMETLHQETVSKLEAGELTGTHLVDYLEKVDESAKILTHNLDRAVRLIKGFKSIAVSQANDEKEKVDLVELTKAVVLSLKPEYKQKKHQIRIEGPLVLVANTYPGLFSQVLTNLLMNSIIHGFGEEQGGEILLVLRQEEKKVLLTYKDNGRGIPKEHLPKIYDPFFTTNRGQGSSGLGLNVVYTIVTVQLKGRIQCSSEEGKGTTFQLEFEVD